MTLSETLFEAVIGMATINSLLERNGVATNDLNARDLIMEKGKRKRKKNPCRYFGVLIDVTTK